MTDTTSFKFLVSWYEPMAGISKEYVLSYFISTGNGPNELSIFDVKNKKTFLKRVPYPSVTMNDLYVGNIVTVYSRQYEVIKYADSKTRETFAAAREKIVIVLPDTLYADFGSILTAAADENLQVTKVKTVSSSPHQLQLWVEFVGDGAFNSWQQVVSRFPRLMDELDNNSVMKPCMESDKVFSSPSTTAAFDNCSLCLVKPHAVKDGYLGPVLSSLMEAKLEVSAVQLFHINRVEAENFLEVYRGVIGNSEYSELTAEVASGPIVAIEVRASDCVRKLRELTGPMDVEVARVLRPTTMRARFGKNNVQNAIHCTDLEEDAVLESQYFFDVLTKNQASV